MYMLNSTRHWRRILNGYSGFRPSSYDRAYNAAKGFPSASSLMALHGFGVTHIVVHMEAFCEPGGAWLSRRAFAHGVARTAGGERRYPDVPALVNVRVSLFQE